MTKSDKDDGLGGYFDAARAQAPQPDGDFLARLERAALAEMPRPNHGAAPVTVTPAPRVGVLSQLGQVLGGWPGAAGLIATCAAGVWLGIAPPEGVSIWLSGETATLEDYGIDALSGFDFALIAEG